MHANMKACAMPWACLPIGMRCLCAIRALSGVWYRGFVTDIKCLPSWASALYYRLGGVALSRTLLHEGH